MVEPAFGKSLHRAERRSGTEDDVQCARKSKATVSRTREASRCSLQRTVGDCGIAAVHSEGSMMGKHSRRHGQGHIRV